MAPTWLTLLAWVSLAAAVLSALDILIDIYVRRYRQHMGIMEAVWPMTALYFGPPASWAYRHADRHGDRLRHRLPVNVWLIRRGIKEAM